MGTISRRTFVQQAGMLAGATALRAADAPVDYNLEIATTKVDLSAKRSIRTTAYNGQVPGPLLRLREGRPVRIKVTNRTANPEIVHWHGLFLPSAMDGAMEEGSPMIPPGGSLIYDISPRPSGFRWFHTHTFAGGDLNKGQYTGQHGLLYVDPANEPGQFDAEFFLTLHDWQGQLLGSDDGAMNPSYDISTINGRTLGYGDPLQVRQNQRIKLQILNSSPTEIHWLSFAGHRFEVVALDGNPVPKPQLVSMLRLAPAERVTAFVTMDNPGVWILGEVRKHVQAAGMGIVVAYAGANGKPVWRQPQTLSWDYTVFGAAEARQDEPAEEIPLVFTAKFKGHGAMEEWCINGKSYPDTDSPVLKTGQRYRLLLKNPSLDDHPIHLHRHVFELRSLSGSSATRGILKDTVLVPSRGEVAVEFVADNPGLTLLHCHQQNHMDLGFMMVFRYA